MSLPAVPARILAIALTTAALSAPDVDAERLPPQTYNTSHGLAHDRVRCVLPDSRGFLWFCTPDGLSRFDGTQFVNYGLQHGLPHPSVEDFVEVGPGAYWAATAGGLARLRPAIGPPSFVTYPLGPDAASNHVFALKKDRAGRLWIGTANGLFVIDGASGEPSYRRVVPDSRSDLPEFGQVRALAEGVDGGLWIGTLSGLLRQLPDGRIVRDPLMGTVGEVDELLADRAGRVWVGHDRGLSVFIPSSPSNATFRPIVSPPLACPGRPEVPLPAVPGEACRFDTLAHIQFGVRSLSEGIGGQVWIGTARGLIEFDGERFRAYTAANKSTNVTINAVADDRAGNVWVGTDAGGVAKLPRHGLVSFKEEDGLRHDYVTSIWQSRAGRLRVGGGWAVLNEFDGERFVSSGVPLAGSLIREPRGHDIVEDRYGDLWVGSPGGLFRFPEIEDATRLEGARPTAIYTIADGLPADRVIPSFADSRGDVWMIAQIGVDYRVVRWRRAVDRFEQFPETDVQLEVFASLSFAEDAAGMVWFGSSRGLARLRNGQFGKVPIQEVMRAVQVTRLRIDASGRLWVGTRGSGLLRSDDPTAEHPRFTVYDAAPQGLSSGTVWCITDDARGDIYVGTPHGVDRLEPDTGQFKHFSVADGLAGTEVIAAFRDRDGALWFGTFTGLSRLTPQPDVAREAPTVWIGGLRIRGTAHPLSFLGESDVSIGQLQPRQNQVQIDFFGLSAETGDPLTYQYRLEDADSGWTTRMSDRSVNYAELASGSYRFQVRAVDAQGRTSVVPASVTFTILRPVWTRWWFLTAMAMLAIASGYAFHRYRVTRLVELERLRTRIASDLHDDLGSSLSQISILSEVARAQLSDGETTNVAAPLSRIGTLARESVDSMSDIVWAIDPLQDASVHLLQRMRHFAAELLSARSIELRFESSGDPRFRLTADIRRHAYLMFKEILNNIVRHAEATTVIVEVTVEPRLVQVVVTDDGRGFDSTTVASGHGLRSMRRRASSLGGALEIRSAPGAGTRVSVTLPVV